jgi:hypothetical protein
MEPKAAPSDNMGVSLPLRHVVPIRLVLVLGTRDKPQVQFQVLSLE